LQNPTHNLAHVFVLYKPSRDAEQMIAEKSVFVISNGCEFRQTAMPRDHFLQATPHQIRMAADQLVIRRKLIPAQRRSIAAIEFGDLRTRKVFEHEPRTDIEGRLMNVGAAQSVASLAA